MNTIKISLKSITTDINNLKPFQGDLKQLAKEDYEKLKKSIIDHDFSEPFTAFKSKKDQKLYILNGHQRHRVLQKMREEGWMIPEVPVSLHTNIRSDKQAKKLVLALTSQFGEITDESLYEYMFEAELDPVETLEDNRFPEVDADDFYDKFFETVKEEDPKEDVVPDTAENEKGVELGDVYILGEHRLMCGDSTDKETFEKLMNGERADMVFTDPPYELLTKGGGLFKKSKVMKEIYELGIDKFNPETIGLHSETNVFCCNKPLIKKYIELAEKNKVSWDLAIYHKQNTAPNYGGHLMTDLEYLFVIGKQSPRTGIGEDKNLYSKLYSGGKDQDNKTAWSKPVALCEKFIKLYSSKSVLDLFGGSGSTIIACEKTNRKCYIMELDPHYCSVIIKRWEKYANKKAKKVSK